MNNILETETENSHKHASIANRKRNALSTTISERLADQADNLIQGSSHGVGRMCFFQIQVSRDHLHTSKYYRHLPIKPWVKLTVCSPNYIIIKNNIILTR